MIVWYILGIVSAFFVGLSIGLIARSVQHKTSAELEKAKKALTHYQDTVNEHVYKTHEIMDNIQKQFADLQQHSQDYSVKLNLDHSRQSLLQPKAYPLEEETKETIVVAEMPKDYADVTVEPKNPS